MKRFIIGIDVDDTLVDTREQMKNYYESKYGSAINAYSHSYLEMCPKMTDDQIGELFSSPTLYANIKMLDNYTMTAVENLSQKHKLIICSIHKGDGIQYKHEMLNRLGLNKLFFNQIYSTNVRDTKDYMHFDIFIDDNMNNLKTNKSTYKILLDKYNLYKNAALPFNVIRMTNWQQVEQFIKEIS